MTCSSSTTSTPDRRRLASALAALALLLAGASAPAPPRQSDLIAGARADLARDDAIAAEMRLRKALDAGAERDEVAALMGAALLAQDQPRKARDWLAPGRFAPADAAMGFRGLGRLARREGRLRDAGAAYDRALALTPDDSQLWVDIAYLRYAGEEHLLAIEAAEKALNLGPDNVRAIELQGRLVRDRFGLQAALPWFEAGLARKPDDVPLLGEYAATLGELGRGRDMLTVTRRMLVLEPRNPRALYLQAVLAARAGETGLARALLNRTGDRLEDLPGAMLLDGVLELRAGNAKLAARTFERLLRRQPANARAQLLLARALDAAGEQRYLVERFAPAASRPDASPYLLTLVGRAWEVLDRRDLAASFLDRAALAIPAFVAPVAEGSPLGALLAAGRLGEAEALVEGERRANPGSADAQARAGDVQLALGRGAEAYERYRLAARVRMPESLALRMAAALAQSGRGAVAGGLIEAYLAQNPSSRAAARLAAELSARDGDWGRARQLLGHLRSNGGARDPRLLADLALARLRAGDAEAATAAGREAWRLQPSSPVATQAWGMSLAALGERRGDAAALLAKARRIAGDNPLLAEARATLARRASSSRT